MAVKTVCPITRTEFDEAAQPLSVNIGGHHFQATPMVFSSNSFGFHANGKLSLSIGGKPVLCQVGLNITVVGSKELAQGGA